MQETTNSSPLQASRKSVIARVAARTGIARFPAWLLRTVVWLFWIGYFGLALLLLLLRYSILPNIEAYRGDIERIASHSLGLKVTIASIDTQWRGLRPHLGLHGFRVYDAAGRAALVLDRIETEIAWSSLARGQLRLHRLEIDAPTLDIRRDANGRIFVAGLQLNTEAEGTDFADWLLSQNRIVVRDATISWNDQMRAAPPLALSKFNFVLQNNGSRHRFGLTAEPPPELATRLDMRGDFRGDDPDKVNEWTGDAYAEVDYADLAVWRAWVDYPMELPQGTGGLRLWLGFAQKQMETVTADIALRDVRLRMGRELPMLDLEFLTGRFSIRLPGSGIEVGARKLALATRDGIRIPETNFQVRWVPAVNKQAPRGEATANDLDLDALARLAGFLPLDAITRQALATYAPRGRIEEVKLGWTGTAAALAAYTVRARFNDLGIKAHGHFPGFIGLSGTIEGNERGGVLNLQSRNAALELPAVFADPRLDLEQLSAQANWALADGRLEVQLQNLAFSGRDATGSASGRYRTSTSGPGEIDLSARLTRGEGAAVWRYMPLVVNRQVRDWLRASITGGRADDVRLRLKGDLKDFPFADGRNGIFEVTAKFDGAQLVYAPDWPGIDNIAGSLRFEGKRMLIRAERGSVFGVAVRGVSAEIADLTAKEEKVYIAGRAEGPTADFLRFIDSSPVAAKIDHFTEGMNASGNGILGLKIMLPLRRLEQSKVEGDYQFSRNGINFDPDLPPLTELGGRVQFTGDAVTLKDARAVLLGSPVVIGAATRADGSVAIDAQGSVSIGALRKITESRLLDHLSGSTSWRGTVLVRKKNADLVFESNLEGISSSLPQPFNKTATEVLPLRFERGPQAETAARRTAAPTPGAALARESVRLTLGKVMEAQLVRRRDAGKTTIERGAIGIGESAVMPEKGVLLSANVKALNVDFWRAQINGHGDAALPLSALNLRTEELTAFGRTFGEVALRAKLENDTWQAQLSSREVAGEVAWNAQGRGRLRARLKQLALNESRADKARNIDEPLRELPGLDVIAENFSLRGHPLGRLELQAANEGESWRIEKLAIANADGTLAADGLWNDGGSRLNFKLGVADSGKMLARLGYIDAVRRGTAKLEGKVSWRGPPTQIDYPSLDGEISLEAARGQFNKMEPGVGRLLGILSLQSLPRRITLDFRDIFSEGFAYDSISGHSRITRGVIATKDLQIQGPSAHISMTGEADIPGETQNLRVRVQPALGESVAVGTMLAYPLAGVAAWLAQKVLKDPLGQIFAFEYAVTGSWSDPKVEKVQQQGVTKQE